MGVDIQRSVYPAVSKQFMDGFQWSSMPCPQQPRPAWR